MSQKIHSMLYIPRNNFYTDHKNTIRQIGLPLTNQEIWHKEEIWISGGDVSGSNIIDDTEKNIFGTENVYSFILIYFILVKLLPENKEPPKQISGDTLLEGYDNIDTCVIFNIMKLNGVINCVNIGLWLVGLFL